MPPLAVAVLGATGYTGREVVFQAILSGYTVYALARDPAQIVPNLPGQLDEKQRQRLHLLKGDVYTPGSFDAAISPASIVFECFGIKTAKYDTLKEDAAKEIIKAMKKYGKKRLVGITSMGIRGDGPAALPWIIRRTIFPLIFGGIMSDLRKYEDIITAEKSWLEYTILQPGPIVVAPSQGLVQLGQGMDGTIWSLPYVDLAREMLEIGLKGQHKKVADLGIIPTKDIGVAGERPHTGALLSSTLRYHVLETTWFKVFATMVIGAVALRSSSLRKLLGFKG